jgi:type I restriction enzyme S subunit
VQIKGKDINTGRIDFDSCDYITEEDHEKCIRRAKPQLNDVLLANIGASIGDCARVTGDIEFSIKNVALLRPDPEAVDPSYFYHLVKGQQFQGRLLNLRLGAAQPYVSLENLRGLAVDVVESHDSQRKIGEIADSYDDLIENNRRRIQLLEQAARLLYKEWFVHLRFPGYEHATITNGVPDGWERKSLGDIADFRLGKMLDQNKNRGDLMPYLANLNVRWGSFDFADLREMRFEQHEIEEFALKYGDIVMCEGGEPGRCAIWKEAMPGMMIQKAIHRIRPHKPLDYRFLYHSLFHKGQTGRLAMLFTGATIKHLPREKLAKVEVEIPSAGLMNLFVQQVGPIERQIAVLQAASRLASEARDLLLPRLMNGEIPI